MLLILFVVNDRSSKFPTGVIGSIVIGCGNSSLLSTYVAKKCLPGVRQRSEYHNSAPAELSLTHDHKITCLCWYYSATYLHQVYIILIDIYNNFLVWKLQLHSARSCCCRVLSLYTLELRWVLLWCCVFLTSTRWYVMWNSRKPVLSTSKALWPMWNSRLYLSGCRFLCLFRSLLSEALTFLFPDVFFHGLISGTLTDVVCDMSAWTRDVQTLPPYIFSPDFWRSTDITTVVTRQIVDDEMRISRQILVARNIWEVTRPL